MRIYTIWPARKDGKPGGSWRQAGRWLVLDVTRGLDDVEIVYGPASRSAALDEELRLRRTKEVSK